jgi:hypothetical protein
MTLDIRGSVKNTKLSSNPYVVFEELISNAIDSFLIRKNQDSSVSNMMVDIEVDFLSADLLDEHESMSVSCRDNGCGFEGDQLKAFVTKDTSYKDDLLISGIGKCKGAGRIQFFHHFSALSIDSTYQHESGVSRCEMHYSEPQKQIEIDDFKISAGSENAIGTTIKLEKFKDHVCKRISHGEPLSSLFSVSALRKQTLVAFLQRLVGLESHLGDFEIKFLTRNWKSGEQSELLKRSDLPSVTEERIIDVEERDPNSGESLGTYQQFKLFHYQLDAVQYDLPKNAIAFCAKYSPVKDITARYLRSKMEQNNPVGGYHHIVLIESDLLDQHVNEQRDDFDGIPDEIPCGDFFSDAKISYAMIYDAIDPVIQKMVALGNWSREHVLEEINTQFGISEAMLADTSTRIIYGEPAQTVVERVLRKYQDQAIDDTAKMYALKEEIIKAEPDSEEFRVKINELSLKYAASLRSIDMVNLSQLIVRRAAIVEILDLACGKNLAMQVTVEGCRRKDERIIHSIFFPMHKDSAECTDHDIWLLSEEYHYYDYIASDMPLADIAWKDNQKLFESDIDQKFQELLASRADDNGSKRPDIALFSKEGTATIIEFKAPGIKMDEHIGDLSEYAHLLAAKSGGKLKRFYCYLIGDTVNPLRLAGWTKFSEGKGWFQSTNVMDPETGQRLGEMYSEIMYFSDVVERAKKRIGVYQNKLNLSFQR